MRAEADGNTRPFFAKSRLSELPVRQGPINKQDCWDHLARTPSADGTKDQAPGIEIIAVRQGGPEDHEEATCPRASMASRWSPHHEDNERGQAWSCPAEEGGACSTPVCPQE